MGRTSLHHAALSGDIETVTRIVSADGSLDVVDMVGEDRVVKTSSIFCLTTLAKIGSTTICVHWLLMCLRVRRESQRVHMQSEFYKEYFALKSVVFMTIVLYQK